MKRRWISLVLAALLAVTASACAPGTTDMPPASSEISEAASGVSSGTDKNTDSSTSGGALPLVEPGSETLTLLTYQNWHASSYYDADGGLPIENKIEEITGVKIEWECVASGDYETVAQTRLAAGSDLPDIVRVPKGAAGLTTYSNQGLFINIKDYMNEQTTPNLIKMFDENPIYEAYCVSPDGGIYGLPHAEYDINNYVVMWNIIRTDWLDTLGLSMPTTIDELHDALVAFKTQDPNGNGEQDEIPLGYQNENMFGLYTMKHAFGFNNTDTWSIQDDDTVQFDLADDKFLSCLTTLNKWYQEGLLNTTVDGSDSDMLIAQDRLGAQTISSMDNVIGKNDSVHLVNEDGNYEFIPLLANPDYPDNEPKLNKRQSFHDYYAVTVDCENPELAVRWLDWVYASEESSVLRYWGFEGDTYTVENGKKQFTDKVAKADTSAIDVMREIGGWPNFVGNENGECFMAMYVDSYCEQAYHDFKDVMIDRVPISIGTPEESETYSQKWPEINDYVKESVINFINGNKPLSEWEDYKAQLQTMGLQDIVAVKQAWYDRMKDIIV